MFLKSKTVVFVSDLCELAKKKKIITQRELRKGEGMKNSHNGNRIE